MRMLHVPIEEREHPAIRRWPVVLAALAVAAGFLLLPDELRLGPRWATPAVLLIFLIPLSIVRRLGHYLMTRRIALALTAVMTVSLIASAIFLIVRLSGGKTTAFNLLRDGALIWGANVLVFAIWYWEIDCGGPHLRHMRKYMSRDFLFPQMTLPESQQTDWAPDFVDYLFLAFNTSSAFSPTDTLILSRQAKVLMMIQSLISITVFGVLIARAINTLS